MPPDTQYCDRCGDILAEGDDYYDLPDGVCCPDCADSWFNRHKRTVGNVIDKF